MNQPSAVEGAPPLGLEPLPSAGLGLKGVSALNSQRVRPAMMSGMWVAFRCEYFFAAVSQQCGSVKKRTPGTPSDNAHEDSITMSYQRRRTVTRTAQ